MNKRSMLSCIALLAGIAPLANAQFVKCTSPDGQSTTLQKHHCSSPTDVETPVTVSKGTSQRAELSGRWEFSFTSQVGNTYRDLSSIKRSGNLVIVREKLDLLQPEHSIRANPPYDYKSVVSTHEYDCADNTARTLDQVNITTLGETKPAEMLITNAMPLIGFMQKSHQLACAFKP